MTSDAELLAMRLCFGLAGVDAIDTWLDEYVRSTDEPSPAALELFDTHRHTLVRP